MAGLQRIIDDVENTCLEAVHVGPTFLLPVEREILELLFDCKDCIAVKIVELERTLCVHFTFSV